MQLLVHQILYFFCSEKAPCYRPNQAQSDRARRPSRVREGTYTSPTERDGRAACARTCYYSLSARGSAEPRPLISRRAQAGDSMQEAPQAELFDKLLCLCLAAPDTTLKLCKPVSEDLWGPMFQELHAWGPEQQ